MLQRFHGIDKHKAYSTISVKDREGKEINFISNCIDLKGYIKTLGSEDAVVLESSTGTFYYADLIEAQGAKCFVIDPYKFKIIKDSWNKTDKRDAKNMSYALWCCVLFNEFKLPEVYKPNVLIRELRKLYTQLNILNRQIRSLKNNIQAVLSDNGIVLKSNEISQLLSSPEKIDTIIKNNISDCSKFSIEQNIDILKMIKNKKEELVNLILFTGEPLSAQVKLLITIKGITPLLALAFLSDVADVNRFTKLKAMNAYLGVCPRVKSSGGKTNNGHINRESRKLSRTIFTQSVYHISMSSLELRLFYTELIKRRGVGRARIALIRKIFGIMRRMLLSGTEYKWLNECMAARKIKLFENKIKNIKF